MTRRAGTKKRKPPRASGATITEDEREKRGQGRLTLRLPAETITLIGILADDAGLSRAQYVHELVERADQEHARRHGGGA